MNIGYFHRLLLDLAKFSYIIIEQIENTSSDRILDKKITFDGDRLIESGNVNYRLNRIKLTRLGADKLSKIELVRLQGGAGGNDLMVAGAKDDFLMGRDGNDTIRGRLGDDEVYGVRFVEAAKL